MPPSVLGPLPCTPRLPITTPPLPDIAQPEAHHTPAPASESYSEELSTLPAAPEPPLLPDGNWAPGRPSKPAPVSSHPNRPESPSPGPGGNPCSTPLAGEMGLLQPKEALGGHHDPPPIPLKHPAASAGAGLLGYCSHPCFLTVPSSCWATVRVFQR